MLAAASPAKYIVKFVVYFMYFQGTSCFHVQKGTVCDPHGDPPLVGDCWYNCTVEDIAGEDKKQRLRKVHFSAFCGFCLPLQFALHHDLKI